MNIWLTADTHFDHKNILKYEPTRQFLTLNEQLINDHFEMSEALIDRWNSVVKPNDLVFHLGDVFFSKAKRAELLAPRLNGRKILIQGNHDYFSKKKYGELGFDMHQYYLLEGLFLSHYPQHETAIRSAINHESIIGNVHGHVHSNISGLDQSIYKCVSTELTNFEPIHIDHVKLHFGRKI